LNNGNLKRKVITGMTSTRYDRIGTNYNHNRKADKRIVKWLDRLLNLPAGSTIADIGAGTGNYTNALANLGYYLKAIEPSEKMRSQAVSHANVAWSGGTAEKIPLADCSVDGVMVILALHHFSVPEQAAVEIQRICPQGPLVILTIDPRQSENFWFKRSFIFGQSLEIRKMGSTVRPSAKTKIF
jgi:ubiquinone/menaquinone biosynthesis C-methylase UbiE